MAFNPQNHGFHPADPVATGIRSKGCAPTPASCYNTLMAGHSKWSKIKHKKAIKDAKKGKIFSIYAQKIAVASRDGGPDPDMNFSLRLLVQNAKKAGMPQNNIDRAIARGAGTGSDGVRIEDVTYEAIAPHNVGLIIETVTDNKNRTVATLRKTIGDNGGQFAENGAVMWKFDRKGLVTLRPARMVKSEKYGKPDEVVEAPVDEVMLEIMDIPNISDIQENTVWDGQEDISVLEVYTDPTHLGEVRDRIADAGYILREAELVYTPKDLQTGFTDEELGKISAFISTIEELDDVKSVYSDIAL